MKSKNTIILLFCLFGLSISSVAQNNKRTEKLFRTAREAYVSHNTDKAIEVCSKILSLDPEHTNAHLLLAEIYKDENSTKTEIQHLTKVQYKNIPLVDFRLGEAYYKMGMYTEALSAYKKYRLNKKITGEKLYLLEKKMANCEFAIQAIKHPVKFEPHRLNDNINSENDEYWATPTLDGEKLVFTRLIKGQLPQEDFFIAELDTPECNCKATPITGINTSENEGAQTLSSDNKLMFFSACNRHDGHGSCDIYFSRFINGKWSKAQNAGSPLNSSSWESHPSLSSDNHFLYFSSNRPGGKGQKDIWRIEFNGFSKQGMPQWGKLENLKALNTKGNEISPFIHANNRNFYFASDTHTGMGGYDLFSAIMDEKGRVSEIKNMGYPINTYKDEIGLTVNATGDKAYFSSARNAHKGQDIFSFRPGKTQQIFPATYVRAKVYDKKTQQPLIANVQLIRLKTVNSVTQKRKTDKKGEVMMAIPSGSDYAFNVSEKGYLFYSQSMHLSDVNTLTHPFILDIALQPIETGAEMQLYNIYFETDSSRILQQSEPELLQLVTFLENNPGLQVSIMGHTDSSGSPGKNLILSEKRAKSVVDYLTKNNIDSNRLTYEGLGDTIPVASNETPEGRKQNRRTTVKIRKK